VLPHKDIISFEFASKNISSYGDISPFPLGLISDAYTSKRGTSSILSKFIIIDFIITNLYDHRTKYFIRDLKKEINSLGIMPFMRVTSL